jgi:hypothetical protein
MPETKYVSRMGYKNEKKNKKTFSCLAAEVKQENEFSALILTTILHGVKVEDSLPVP